MAELVNLRLVKKRRAKAAAEVAAAAQRLRHGRTKAQRLADGKAETLARARVDHTKLDAPEPTSC